MRRSMAIVVVVIFASLNAIDCIVCPDGCTYGEEATSTPSTPESSDGICLLCVGGLSRSIPDDLSPGVTVATTVTALCMTNPDDVAPEPPEHPPWS